MSTQYHAESGSVKPRATKTTRDNAPRIPATFTPYYHQAYNAVVQPRRFDHYFIQRWMRVLGPVGFAIVKALRDMCYHNPATGALRDSVELTIEELAEVVGVSPSTVKREMKDNEALALFVSRESQYHRVGNTVVRKANRWRVSMDEPIHEQDAARYDALLRGEDTSDAGVISCTCQNDTDSKSEGSCRGQNDPHYKGQNDPHYKGQNDPVNNSLPSGGLYTKETNTATPGNPPINPPKGEEKIQTIPKVWMDALTLLKPEVGAMTYNCRLRAGLEFVEESDSGVRLRALDAPTVEWAARDATREMLVKALSACRGRETKVQFIQ